MNDGKGERPMPSRYEKVGTFKVNFTIQDISVVMKNATKETYTDCKVTPNLSKIYNDLIKSENNSPSIMLNLLPLLCTDTCASKNGSNIIIGGGCEFDICLDGYEKEILSIIKDLQCSPNPVNKSQSQINVPSVRTKQCQLSGSFVSDTEFNLSRKVFPVT